MAETFDLRNQPPVEVNAERPERASQTLLRHADRCRHSAYLYLRLHGGAPSHDLDRGSCFHEFARRATLAMIEMNEPRLPPDLAKELMAECMADPEFTVPAKEADALREMAWHFAEGVMIAPEMVVAVERIFTLELGNWTISGKLDLALAQVAMEGFLTASIWDYKTSWNIPPREQFVSLDSEGEVIGARRFQLIVYALLYAYGIPEGETKPLGDGFEVFNCSELYPRYIYEDGIPLRTVTIPRADLADHRRHVEAVLAKLEHGFETGEWPAVQGSHCVECPAKPRCPIPPDLRDYHGSINSAEDAAYAAARHERLEQEKGALWAELKDWAGFDGPIPYGKDLVLDFKLRTSEQIRNKDALDEAIERAVQFGEPFDREKHFKQREETRLRKRTLEPHEQEEDHDGSKQPA